MTAELITYILPSARSMRNNAEALLKGITPDIFARKPKADGVVIEMNHPAFLYGHLSLYPALVLEMLHLPFSDVKAPENFPELFKNGAQCHDDADGSRYPKMNEITTIFLKGYDTLLERALQITNESLLEVTPGERVARFPVKGNFLVHLMTSHMGLHLGQVSSWRRSMKLPPA